MSFRWVILGAYLLGATAPAVGQSSAPVAQEAVSPAKLALGRAIAARLLPDGTYQQMMSGTFAQLMGSMTDQMADVPLAPFLRASGLSQEDVAKLGSTTIREVLDIIDPVYDQRMKLMMPVMLQQMGEIMGGFEPEMREGLAEAYAARFTDQQLTDIAAFLETPSGRVFAAQNLTVATDPAVLKRMQAMMPRMMQGMPAVMAKALAATEGLPKAKTLKTLTAEDRAQLAKLLGIESGKLK